MLHIVSAIALNKGHVGQIERFVLDHAKVRTCRELVGGLVDNARVGLTVKDVLDLALGSVGTAGHKLRGVGIGVGSERSALTQVVVEGIEHRHDVGLAHRRILGMVHIVEAVLVRGSERLGTLGILRKHLRAVAREVGLECLKLGDGGTRHVIPGIDPIHDLVEHGLVAGIGTIGLGRLLQTTEELNHLVAILGGCGTRGNLALESLELGLDIGGLTALEDHATAGIALHVAAQLAQRVGALRGDGRIVVDVGERILPSLIGVFLALPQIPGEIGVHEDAGLGRLGLLHGV